MRPSLRKYWILFGVAFCVVVAGSAALIAQAGRDDTPAPADAAKTAVPKKAPDKYLNLSEGEFDEVVQVLNLYTLEKDLVLTDDQLVRVLPKWRQLMEMRRGFWGDRRERLGELRHALARQDDPDTSLDSNELDLVVGAFRGEDDTFWGRYREVELSILAELEPVQKVRYILVDSEQGRRTRRLVGTLRRINRPPQAELVHQAPTTDAKPTTVATSDR
jgi:hypothetical protein